MIRSQNLLACCPCVARDRGETQAVPIPRPTSSMEAGTSALWLHLVGDALAYFDGNGIGTRPFYATYGPGAGKCLLRER